LLGGTAAGAGNLVSGNTSYGLDIFAGNNNQVQGNAIGTDATASQPLGNGTGVFIQGSAGNLLRGAAAGAGNASAVNQGGGVLVDGFLGQATGNAILRNAIFANAGLGIELRNGGNNNQPAPVLTSATSAGGVLTVQGTYTGRPSTTY